VASGNGNSHGFNLNRTPHTAAARASRCALSLAFHDQGLGRRVNQIAISRFGNQHSQAIQV
jgi:hypothetical protein